MHTPHPLETTCDYAGVMLCSVQLHSCLLSKGQYFVRDDTVSECDLWYTTTSRNHHCSPIHIHCASVCAGKMQPEVSLRVSQVKML